MCFFSFISAISVALCDNDFYNNIVTFTIIKSFKGDLMLAFLKSRIFVIICHLIWIFEIRVCKDFVTCTFREFVICTTYSHCNIPQ